MRILVFILLLASGSSAFANQCADLFREQSISINGNRSSNAELKQLIANFKEPVVKIEVVDSGLYTLYEGYSAKAAYIEDVNNFVSFYREGLLKPRYKDIALIRTLDPDVRTKLFAAKSSHEVVSIYKQYFLKKNGLGLKDLENDTIIHFKLDSQNFYPGIKASLDSNGAIKDLRVGPLDQGLYALRLYSKDSVKEVIFRVKN